MSKFQRGWLADEFDYRFKNSEKHSGQTGSLELIGQVQEAIGCGQPFDVSSEWPQSVRQLFEEQDFYFVGNKVFKKVDPITDAFDGNAGTDEFDQDNEVLASLRRRILDRPEAQAWLDEHKDLFEEKPADEDALAYVDESVEDVENVKAESDEDDDEEFDVGRVLNNLDTVSFGSPWCGLGYKAPKARYEFREIEKRSNWHEKACERKSLYADMIAELKDIGDEATLNEFLDKIREDYYQDKMVRKAWNRKAFDEDRSIYLDTLTRIGFDQEFIRRKLWVVFDMTKCRTPSIYTYQNGKKVRMSLEQHGKALERFNKSKDSIWLRKRSEAFSELILTTTQWANVYNLAKVVRQRCRGYKLDPFKRVASLAKRINEARNEPELRKIQDLVVKEQGLYEESQARNLWLTAKSRIIQLKKTSQTSTKSTS